MALTFFQETRTTEKVEGSDDPIARLGVAEEYAGAWAELDFALRLQLAGIPCEFIPRTPIPTPDLCCEIKDEKVDVEVTSIARPDEDMVSLWIMGEITGHLFQQGCVGGGLFGKEPNQGEAKQLLEKVVDAAQRAKENHQKEIVNVPGLLTCYVVPEDLASEIPKEWLGHFEMATRTPTPTSDRLRRKIDEKAKRQLSGSKAGFLVVHNLYSSQEEMIKLADNIDVGAKIGTFPSLVGTMLVQSFLSYDPLNPIFSHKDRTVFLEHHMLDGEAERSVIWSNPIVADLRRLFDSLIECQRNLPANLTSLA